MPESVTRAMTAPIFLHRSDRFRSLFREINEGLTYVFQTTHDVLTFAASGTGAMEAAVANLLSPGDRVVTVQGGKFGQRWTELCKVYGAEPEALDVEWGKVVDPDRVAERLGHRGQVKAVFVTHSETSTGVINDVEAIARAVRGRSDALLVVDGISSVGVMPLKTDEWGIDVVVAGSQKGFMLPPGLSFASVSPRAWEAAERSASPAYYFSFIRAREALGKGDTAYTPAISLLVGLKESLGLIRAEGIENVWARHARLAAATRTAVEALGLKLLADSPSNALTAVKAPNDLTAEAIINRLRQGCGITVSGGQGRLQGKIFRIGHLGHCEDADIVAVISGLEQALADLGWVFELGVGVKAAQRALSVRPSRVRHNGEQNTHQ